MVVDTVRIPFIIHKDAPLANVCSFSGAIIIGMGAYFAHDITLIGILMIIVGFALLFLSNVIAIREKKKNDGARYILNKDGTYTCKDCNNIIPKLPCPFCEVKHEEYMEFLDNTVLCQKCGAAIKSNSDTCPVCGEKQTTD